MEVSKQGAMDLLRPQLEAGVVEKIAYAPASLPAKSCRAGDLRIWSLPNFENTLTLYAPAGP